MPAYEWWSRYTKIINELYIMSACVQSNIVTTSETELQGYKGLDLARSVSHNLL